MGKRKSAARKIIEGDAGRVGVHVLDGLAARAPKVQAGLPGPSKRLRGDARRIYRSLRESLDLAGLAASVDAFALERASVALAVCWQCDRELATQELVTKVPIVTGAGRGNKRKIAGYRQVKNRLLAVRAEAERTFFRYARQFGLCGPDSRSGLEIDAHSLATANQELAELLLLPREKKEPIEAEKPC